MKCDFCKNTASVFLTQIIHGQMTTANLCDACSKQKGVTDEAGFGLAEAFLGAPAASAGSAVVELVCPACGFTASQLKKIGRMGCPECYSTFREGLDTLLRAMHKGLEHHGKRPEAAAVTAAPAAPLRRTRRSPAKSPAKAAAPQAEELHQPTLAELRQQLDAAVSEERFEDAARLKKLIDAMATEPSP